MAPMTGSARALVRMVGTSSAPAYGLSAVHSWRLPNSATDWASQLVDIVEVTLRRFPVVIPGVADGTLVEKLQVREGPE